MPLLSGEYAGVIRTSRPTDAPKARVSCAAYGAPLSVSHSMGRGTAATPGNRRSTASAIWSRIISPVMAAVVAVRSSTRP